MSKYSTSVAQASQRDSNLWKQLLWFELFYGFALCLSVSNILYKSRQNKGNNALPALFHLRLIGVTNTSPVDSPPGEHNQINNTALFFFLYWKPESLLEEQTTWLLIVLACLSAPINCPQGLNTGERREWRQRRLHSSSPARKENLCTLWENETQKQSRNVPYWETAVVWY